MRKLQASDNIVYRTLQAPKISDILFFRKSYKLYHVFTWYLVLVHQLWLVLWTVKLPEYYCCLHCVESWHIKNICVSVWMIIIHIIMYTLELKKSGEMDWEVWQCRQQGLLCWGLKKALHMLRIGGHNCLSCWSLMTNCSQSIVKCWHFQANSKKVRLALYKLSIFIDLFVYNINSIDYLLACLW